MRQMNINYLTGDATQPAGDGPKIIVHICNDVGGWGRGFVLAISKRWPEPERQFRAWHRGETGQPFALGEVQFVEVDESISVANLIGQHDIHTIDGIPPVRYDAIRKGLQTTAAKAKQTGASVHMPRIGCGLAGGKWELVSEIVERELTKEGVAVFVYDPSNYSAPA
jgi:O-acetyl-ADP-ribose deacetylase (regulator of RNase III)